MTWSIQQGDSLHLLRTIDDESIDLVHADGPYSSGGAFRSDRHGSAKGKYLRSESAAVDRLPEFHGDNRSERALLAWSALWMSEAWRAAKPGAAIAVWCDWRSLPVISDAIQAGGWTWRGLGCWIKPKHTCRPVLGGLWNDAEYIAWGSKGPRASGECLPGSWTAAPPSSATRMHVTEKPQAVLEDLVRLAPPGGLVVDPFAGSGSSGVAALNKGRKWIGFELSHEYTAITAARLAAVETTGADMRTDPDSLFSPHHS